MAPLEGRRVHTPTPPSSPCSSSETSSFGVQDTSLVFRRRFANGPACKRSAPPQLDLRAVLLYHVLVVQLLCRPSWEDLLDEAIKEVDEDDEEDDDEPRVCTARPPLAPYSLHLLSRFLLDSRQVESDDRSQIYWMATDCRDSFLFLMSPPRKEIPEVVDTSFFQRTMALLSFVASLILLTGTDVYELPSDRTSGLILFEVPFSDITGMDYSNGLTSDGRWAIEVSEVNKYFFTDYEDMWSFVMGVAPGAATVLAAAVAGVVAEAKKLDLELIGLCEGPHRFLKYLQPEEPYVGLVQRCCEEEEEEALLSMRLTSATSFRRVKSGHESYRTNMVVTYWGDNSPELPAKLKEILMQTKRARELNIVESGLPSWTIFLPQRNVYYRTWLRRVVQTISIVWPIITLIAALVDLYRSFEAIRDIAHAIADWFGTCGGIIENLAVALRGVAWRIAEPWLMTVWGAMSEFWQSVLVAVGGHVTELCVIAGLVMGEIRRLVTAFPIFTALAETKAYFVSMLLPYAVDLLGAITTALRIWIQVISNTCRIFMGSTSAMWRMVTGVAYLPSWLVTGLRPLFNIVMKALALRAGDVVPFVNETQRTADTAIRWTIFNRPARQAVTGVVSRTYNLIVWIGTEISKHWETRVVRPTNSLATWIRKHWSSIVVAFLALFPFGVLSHTCDEWVPTSSTTIELLRDCCLYAISFVMTRFATTRLALGPIMAIIYDKSIQQALLAVLLATTSWLELSSPSSEKSVKATFLVLIAHMACWHVVFQLPAILAFSIKWAAMPFQAFAKVWRRKKKEPQDVTVEPILVPEVSVSSRSSSPVLSVLTPSVSPVVGPARHCVRCESTLEFYQRNPTVLKDLSKSF
eukprot:Sspe_Gene.40939::Locus_19777_Transcript_1_1_Confidence_1.000_Length_2829::g.40939::m.40939